MSTTIERTGEIVKQPDIQVQPGRLRAAVLALLGAAVLCCGIGCGAPLDEPGPTDRVDQAVTGCEVDCPNGSTLTCSTTPCMVVNATTLSCGGVTSQCPTSPPCIPRTCDDVGAECGALSDGCGHNLNCGFCPAGEICRNHVCSCKVGGNC